jgi:hypothetical protein
MSKTPPQKRTWFSNFSAPFLQIKMGFYVLSLCFLYALIFGIYLWDSYEEQYFRFEYSYEGENAAPLFHQTLQSQYALAIACLIGIFLLSMLWLVIRRTHRMYGPMVAVNRHLDEMLEDKYSGDLKIRASDDFHELVESLNRLRERLKSESTTPTLIDTKGK